MLREKTLCCFTGKRRLYKVLNAGVPIIVAQVVLLKIYYLLMRDFIFFHNKVTSIKGLIFLNFLSVRLSQFTKRWFFLTLFTHLYQGGPIIVECAVSPTRPPTPSSPIPPPPCLILFLLFRSLTLSPHLILSLRLHLSGVGPVCLFIPGPALAVL